MTAAGILDRLIRPEEGDLSADAARSILGLRFSEGDRRRMQALARKSNRSGLSASEESDATRYELIGNLLGRLQSKARRSLKRATCRG